MKEKCGEPLGEKDIHPSIQKAFQDADVHFDEFMLFHTFYPDEFEVSWGDILRNGLDQSGESDHASNEFVYVLQGISELKHTPLSDELPQSDFGSNFMRIDVDNQRRLAHVADIDTKSLSYLDTYFAQIGAYHIFSHMKNYYEVVRALSVYAVIDENMNEWSQLFQVNLARLIAGDMWDELVVSAKNITEGGQAFSMSTVLKDMNDIILKISRQDSSIYEAMSFVTNGIEPMSYLMTELQHKIAQTAVLPYPIMSKELSQLEQQYGVTLYDVWATEHNIPWGINGDIDLNPVLSSMPHFLYRYPWMAAILEPRFRAIAAKKAHNTDMSRWINTVNGYEQDSFGWSEWDIEVLEHLIPTEWEQTYDVCFQWMEQPDSREYWHTHIGLLQLPLLNENPYEKLYLFIAYQLAFRKAQQTFGDSPSGEEIAHCMSEVQADVDEFFSNSSVGECVSQYQSPSYENIQVALYEALDQYVRML